MKRRGFSLMELLVAVVVLVGLAGVTVPLVRSALARSREATCLTNLRSLGVALEGYLQDHNQVLPTLEMGRSSRAEDVPVLEVVLLPYVGSPDAFKCPQDSDEFAKSGSSYFWNRLQNGRHVTNVAFFGIEGRPDKIPLISDKESWHPSGTNFLYADQTSSNKMRFAATN